MKKDVCPFLGLSSPTQVKGNLWCVTHASHTFWALTNGFLITSNGQTIIFKLPASFWSIVSDLWALQADVEAAVPLTASVAFHLTGDVAQQTI